MNNNNLFSRKMTFTLNEEDKKTVRILFISRIIMWVIAAGGFL